VTLSHGGFVILWPNSPAILIVRWPARHHPNPGNARLRIPLRAERMRVSCGRFDGLRLRRVVRTVVRFEGRDESSGSSPAVHMQQ